MNGSTSWTQELELSESFQAFQSNSNTLWWTNIARKITIFNGKNHYELSFSIAMLVHQRVKACKWLGPLCKQIHWIDDTILQNMQRERWHNSCFPSTIHVYHHGTQPSTDQTRYGNHKTIRPRLRPQAWVPVGPHGTPSSRPNEQQQAANSWSWLVDSMSLPSQNMWLLMLLTNKHMESQIELKRYGYCIIG